jgi:hypothetical protein
MVYEVRDEIDQRSLMLIKCHKKELMRDNLPQASERVHNRRDDELVAEGGGAL